MFELWLLIFFNNKSYHLPIKKHQLTNLTTFQKENTNFVQKPHDLDQATTSTGFLFICF